MISTDSPNDCGSPFADWTGQLSRPGLAPAEVDTRLLEVKRCGRTRLSQRPSAPSSFEARHTHDGFAGLE